MPLSPAKMPTSSLLDTTRRRLQRSIDLIVDVGDLPFHVLEPVLKKVENPQQLRQIEANSPHIAEDTGPLWFSFIKRDIQNWEKKAHKPRNPTMWGKVYDKLSREQKEEFAAQEAALKVALAKKEQERKKNTSKLLDRAIDPVKHRRMHTSSGPSITRDPRNYTFMPGESKKRLTGRGIIAKIQHKAQATVAAKRSNSLMNVPTHLLSSRTRTLSAPKSMVAEKSRAPQPIDRGKQAPSRLSLPRRPAATPGDSNQRQRNEAEARLRALTSGATPVAQLTKVEGAGRDMDVEGRATDPMADTATRPLKRKAEANCLMPARKK